MWIPTPSSGDISLYFHLPFCHKKCDYCHFFVLPNKEIFKTKLLEALLIEIEQKRSLYQSKNICSIYFGGGTPALVGPQFIQTLLDALEIKLSIDIEVTLEVNPENHDLDTFKNFKKAGINRLSLGVQSFDDSMLQKLGRTHHSKDTQLALENARNAQFENISIDLMYDLPEQTLQDWEKTLSMAMTYEPDHISLYNLSIEKRSVFYKYRKEISSKMPKAKDSLKMFEMAQSTFKKHGYDQYEISAFCKHGAYSKHNVGYWLQRPHLGFGPSAFSFFENKRFQNVAHLNKYHQSLEKSQSPVDFTETLDPQELLRESLALNLRLLQGLDRKTFEKRFGTLPDDLDETLLKLQKEKLITQKDGHLKLTEQGLLFHDAIASEII